MRLFLALTLIGWGCRGSDPEVRAPFDGPLDLGPVNPFPNHALVQGGGLVLPTDVVDAPLPDVSRLAWRTGFGPAQSSVLRLPGIASVGLPSHTEIRPGEGSVRMLDLDTGSYLPILAELDAYPDAVDPALIVRPLAALPIGHSVAIAVLTDAVARPASFEALLSGEVSEVDTALSQHTREVVDAFVEAGVARAEVAVAWDFRVTDPSLPLRSALSQLETQGPVAFDRVRTAGEGVSLPPLTWRAAEGSYTVTDFLVDDAVLDLQADGSVLPVGSTEAELYVHIPASVAMAPAGSVPVMVFGHGIFSEPARYLDDETDPSGLLALAEEGGFIVVATTWRGLTFDDSVDVLIAAQDFSTFPVVPERLVQGQVNVRTLTEIARSGALFDDEVFLGEAGQSLPDSGQVFYYGISLGAIQGAVLLANAAPLDASALHVGGAFWSTMLERSSNWTTFEVVMKDAVPEPADRQLLYAISQLWWDPVDPASYVADLTDRSMLFQYALGDEQVPNLTSEALARSIDLPVLSPNDHVPFGTLAIDAPLDAGSRALVQFDPELPWPDPTNRPAEVTGAHGAPRLWPGARAQVIDHLSGAAAGQIIHHCGPAVCSASNPGI